MNCKLIIFTLTILLSYYVSISFAQSPRRGRIKYGRDHDDIDIQQSDKIATIENPIGVQSQTSSRFRPRAITPSTTIKTTSSPSIDLDRSTKKFQRSRAVKKIEDEQTKSQVIRKPSNRQSRTFTSRPSPSKIADDSVLSSTPKYPGGRRRIEKIASTAEPVLADIEEENYPQHFKEHVKSQLPYKPTLRNRPANYKVSKSTTTTSEKPYIVEVTTARKKVFKPRMKIERPTASTAYSITKTPKTATKTRVFFPQKNFGVEKSTADNEIYEEPATQRSKYSAKFSTESPVTQKHEDVLRNSKLSASQKFSSKYRSDSLSYSLSKSDRGRQAYKPTIPPYVPLESKNQPMHIYPEKTNQMVYDEAAGIWNMVEIVPNGLTRSDITVDTGDVHTQDLEDQLGSSATISIYSALADILTKNTPPTTTTTTTSTTTELPEIIKENPVLLDILKKNYIRGGGKGSKSVFSLTTAKSAIESSTATSGNDVFDEIFGIGKSSLENTLIDSTELNDADDNFILKSSKNSVPKNAIENDILGNLRSTERESSTTTTSTTSTTTMRSTPTTPVPSTSTVSRNIMTITPETVIDNANSIDFDRELFTTSTTEKPKDRKPSASVEKNLELLQELLSLQAKIEKQNAKKTTHSPITASTVTSTITRTTTNPPTTTTTPVLTTTKRLITSSSVKSTFSDTEDLLFLENLKKAINQKTKPPTTSTQASTTYMDDLYNSFQSDSSSSSVPTKSTYSDQEDLDFLNNLRQLAKVNVTTSQSPTFANRVIELAALQRNKTTPIASTTVKDSTSTTLKTTTTPTSSKPATTTSNYDYKKEEAQIGQDLALLSTLLGRRISLDDIPKLAQQYETKPKQTTIKTTTIKATTTSPTTIEIPRRSMTKDELAEVNKNLKLLSSILGRPISIEELPTIMKQYKFGRTPTKTTTTTTTKTTTTTAAPPIINSNTPITRDEVIELLKDPQIGLGDNIDTYGKTNDAILAAVLKQRGIGPTHNNVPVDDLFMQGPTPTPYVTVRPRRRRPIQQQEQVQQPANPLLSGLSWLWRTWQETAPGVRPERGPNRTNRNSHLQSEGSEDMHTEVERHPDSTPTEYPQPGGGLLAAAFSVTRAVTQFLGTAFQGAARSVQQSWNTDNPFATSG